MPEPTAAPESGPVDPEHRLGGPSWLPFVAGALCLGFGVGLALGARMAKKAGETLESPRTLAIPVHDCEECARRRAAERVALERVAEAAEELRVIEAAEELRRQMAEAGEAPGAVVVVPGPPNGADPTAPFSPAGAGVGQG